MSDAETVIAIRPARREDAEEVARLSHELGYPATALEIGERIRAISGDDNLLLVAVAEEKPIGFVQAKRVCVIEAGESAEILGLVVPARARRTGLGCRLVGEVDKWARNIGVIRVTVRSNTIRKESHIFYPAMGFEKVKTQAVYEKRLG